jgi:hypothetical protein
MRDRHLLHEFMTGKTRRRKPAPMWLQGLLWFLIVGLLAKLVVILIY